MILKIWKADGNHISYEDIESFDFKLDYNNDLPSLFNYICPKLKMVIISLDHYYPLLLYTYNRYAHAYAKDTLNFNYADVYLAKIRGDGHIKSR